MLKKQLNSSKNFGGSLVIKAVLPILYICFLYIILQIMHIHSAFGVYTTIFVLLFFPIIGFPCLYCLFDGYISKDVAALKKNLLISMFCQMISYLILAIVYAFLDTYVLFSIIIGMVIVLIFILLCSFISYTIFSFKIENDKAVMQCAWRNIKPILMSNAIMLGGYIVGGIFLNTSYKLFAGDFLCIIEIIYFICNVFIIPIYIFSCNIKMVQNFGKAMKLRAMSVCMQILFVASLSFLSYFLCAERVSVQQMGGYVLIGVVVAFVLEIILRVIREFVIQNK